MWGTKLFDIYFLSTLMFGNKKRILLARWCIYIIRSWNRTFFQLCNSFFIIIIQGYISWEWPPLVKKKYKNETGERKTGENYIKNEGKASFWVINSQNDRNAQYPCNYLHDTSSPNLPRVSRSCLRRLATLEKLEVCCSSHWIC